MRRLVSLAALLVASAAIPLDAAAQALAEQRGLTGQSIEFAWKAWEAVREAYTPSGELSDFSVNYTRLEDGRVIVGFLRTPEVRMNADGSAHIRSSSEYYVVNLSADGAILAVASD